MRHDLTLTGTVLDTPDPPALAAADGKQQMQAHLDIAVTDLEAASAHALAEGATLAEVQPQEHVLVCFDPDGHPFCLYVPGGGMPPPPASAC